jgi:3-methyladenine DNA glycosylase AlkD
MTARPATLAALRRDLKAAADPERAAGTAGFFKTGPGEYGEGDKFLGIRVPELRRIVRAHRELSRADTLSLLKSPWHEERLAALMLLVDAHQHGTRSERGVLHRDYLANTEWINNWDLVDASAGELVGSHIAARGTARIETLSLSKSLWERRIAIVATLFTIRNDDFAPTLLIAERLLGDQHDLIHKAVGWMLREVGKRDAAVLRRFLDAHAATMPRTALRYAIERLKASERSDYLRRKANEPAPLSRRARTKRTV